MIIVSGTVQIQANKVDDAKAAMQVMAAATQKEEGCIHYQFYQDIDDPTLILFYEEWTSAEALDAHMQTPHMAVLQSQMPDFIASPVKGKRFEAKELN